MPIRRSSTPEIQSLVGALSSTDVVRRESAIARLAVIGGRAVERLVASYPAAPRATRIAILRTLEGIADPRAIPVARTALHEGGDVAVAAASTLRSLLESTDGNAATQALDALVERALDATAERRIRLAAFEALADMPEAVRAPVAAALRDDGSERPGAPQPSLAEATWQDAVDGRLPEEPAALTDVVGAHAASAPLSTLQKLVDAVRAREIETSSRGLREGWREVRGQIHAALAQRGSRVAAYDLEETLASTSEPLPGTFVAAARTIGDESCLEPIAAAWSAASGKHATAWRRDLEGAFTAIVKREKISKRRAVLKRIASRWPGFPTG